MEGNNSKSGIPDGSFENDPPPFGDPLVTGGITLPERPRVPVASDQSHVPMPATEATGLSASQEKSERLNMLTARFSLVHGSLQPPLIYVSPYTDNTPPTSDQSHVPMPATEATGLSASQERSEKLDMLSTRLYLGQSGTEPQKGEQMYVSPYVEDMPPTNTTKSTAYMDHPFRQEIEKQRESRNTLEILWKAWAVANPQRTQKATWPVLARHEMGMKLCCTEEFDYLEFIERVDEGESYEDLNLKPEMLARCLAFEDLVKARSLESGDSVERPGGRRQGDRYGRRPINLQQGNDASSSSDTVLPSIETDDEKLPTRPFKPRGRMAAMPKAQRRFPIYPAHGRMTTRSMGYENSFSSPAVPAPGQVSNASLYGVEALGGNPVGIPGGGESQWPSLQLKDTSSSTKTRSTNTGVAAKRRRDVSTVQSGSANHKRPRLNAKSQSQSQSQQVASRLARSPSEQKLMDIPAFTGSAMPTEAVSEEKTAPVIVLHSDDE